MSSNFNLSHSRRALMRTATFALGAIPFATSDFALASTTQMEPTGFFTVAKLQDRWWFISPEGSPFFSIGLNHIDPSPLRIKNNGDLWERKYENSMKIWLTHAVAPDLKEWGFNSVGWAQEVVTRGISNHRHSRGFTFDEYQWLNIPYCHQLPFADFHQWEVETRYPDFKSPEFAEWCDYVAREHCVPMKDDPKLIGYFYIDCPTWIHTTKYMEWKGPIFDPEKLKDAAGRKELKELATVWYQTTHDAIRRYDKHHLILGDRYEAAKPIAEEVIEASLPFVDVLSFQDFRKSDLVVKNLDHWHSKTGKPVLLADHAVAIKQPDGGQRHDGVGYAETLRSLQTLPSCVGSHLCGAYLRNEIRKRALRDASEHPDMDAIEAIKQANTAASQWINSFSR